ncbi:MAG: 4-hydroxy-tetrahydrodipicolinate synthase [SAR202 cluster bacterium]|nr:4-hydroxy-tetrahydrodipicolinate synthase [SAR202 cluster bacterium]|tara:strand:- start:39242 stop:40135 length:894 start_codon:yes stop_codon:yes gene_type:complete
MKIGRLITAMITPFNDQGDVDYIKSRKLASALIESGSDGLLVGGTTGESPSMSDDEKLRLFSEIKSEVGDNVSVIAGTTDNNHKKSLELSLEAEKIGVDALLLTVPSYNKPTQEGLYRHFKSIAEAVSIPGILYNVPSRTSLNMDLGTTLRLAEIDNIIGIKEASSDQFQITQIIDSSPDDFLVWSGNDDETFQVMSVGGYGIVSVASNIIGLQIKDMITLILSGKFSDAAMQHRKLLPLFKALFWVTNPIPVKYALNISGFPVGGVRLPLYEPDTDFVNKFDNIISDFEIDIKYPS